MYPALHKKYILGIDVGATFIKIGALTKNGEIVYKTSFSTNKFQTKKDFIKGLMQYINIVLKNINVSKKHIQGLGIGVPGTVDYEKGVVHNLTNIKGWDEVPLKNIMQGLLNIPVRIDNDANAFANGQLRWGAARKANNAICVTLGSGVGGGLIINGDIYRGSSYCAGEIGHICIDINGPICGCGMKGCLEAFVGNRHIIKRVIGKIKKGKKTILIDMVKGNLSKITPKTLTEAAKRNDKFSIAIWKETAAYLGIGLAGLVNVINPDKIIIGGGVSKAGKFIFAPLKAELAKHAMKPHLKILKIVPADFADDAGIIGAASLVI